MLNIHIFLILIKVFPITAIQYCDHSCENIREDLITVYKTDSELCKRDLPVSFIKDNNLVVAFLSNFEKLINESETCPIDVLSNLLKKLTSNKSNRSISSNQNSEIVGLQHSNETVDFFSEFVNEKQDSLHISVIVILLLILICLRVLKFVSWLA